MLKSCLLVASVALLAACGARSSLDTVTASVGGAMTAGGNIGTGSTNSNGGASSTYAKLLATSIGAGSIHTCAILTDGTVRCWGDNGYGELGNGSLATTSCGCSTTPVRVSGITNPAAVAAGLVYTCAMLSDGTVQCWGYNYYGQLGNRSTANSSRPVTVSGINGAIAVSTGYEQSCAVLSDGTIACWGYNSHGELGDGSTTNRLLPGTVAGINNAVNVGAGNGFTCAILSDGTTQCWGANEHGQLGNGTTTSSPLPVVVSGF